MHKIKLGNDIQVGVSILRGDSSEDLSAATNIKVKINQVNAEYKTLPCYNLKVDGGKVSFLLKGADQLLDDNRYVGVYVVTISYNKPDPTQEPPLSYHTVDALAFELIPHSFASIGNGSSCPNVLVETIELEGCVQFGKDGITPHIGDNGNWWLGEKDTGVFASGADGKSAYQSALDGGLPAEITEEEFNQYLAMNSEIIGEALDEINGEGFADNVIKKIVRIDTTKKKIAEAIVAKGVPIVDTDTFASYADKIIGLPAGESEIEKLYKELGFEYALGDAGVLMEMARISYEITKDWTDYSKAQRNKVIRFVPKLPISPTDFTYALQGCSGLTSIAGVDFSQGTIFNQTFDGCTGLTSIAGADFSQGTDFNGAFQGCTGLTSIAGADFSQGTNFYQTFAYCSGLTSIAGVDFSQGTIFNQTFFNCTGLTSIAGADFSQGTDFARALAYCSGLTSIAGADFSQGTIFFQTFDGCTGLTSIAGVDFSQGTDFTYALQGCSGLTSIAGVDFSQGTNFYQTFAYCSGLTSIAGADFSQGTNFNGAFQGCTGLTSIAGADFSQGTDFTGTLYGCTGLTSIAGVDFSQGTIFNQTFSNCSGLTSIAGVDFSQGTNFYRAFQGCTGLMHLKGFNGLRANVDFSSSKLLTVESMMNVIRNAADMTGLPTFTITFGAINMAKLTPEEIAEATNKNITLR